MTPHFFINTIKSFAMYQCSVELSVRYDGQSRNESEHASLIAEHAPLILWQTSDFEHWICSSGSTA